MPDVPLPLTTETSPPTNPAPPETDKDPPAPRPTEVSPASIDTAEPLKEVLFPGDILSEPAIPPVLSPVVTITSPEESTELPDRTDTKPLVPLSAVRISIDPERAAPPPDDTSVDPPADTPRPPTKYIFPPEEPSPDDKDMSAPLCMVLLAPGPTDICPASPVSASPVAIFSTPEVPTVAAAEDIRSDPLPADKLDPLLSDTAPPLPSTLDPPDNEREPPPKDPVADEPAVKMAFPASEDELLEIDNVPPKEEPATDPPFIVIDPAC